MGIALKIEKKTVTVGGIKYSTYKLIGRDRFGNRVRFQSQNRDAALAEKQRLEIDAAKAPDEGLRNTHLTSDQIREAESAFARLAQHPSAHLLGDHSLSLAVDHFFKTYHPPRTDKKVSEIITLFKADMAKRSTAYKKTLFNDVDAFSEMFGEKRPHEVTRFHAYEFMNGRTFIPRGAPKDSTPVSIDAKRWNNLRGTLHAFFAWCAATPREWVAENPFTKVETKEWTTGTPETLTPQQSLDLMLYAMNFKGGAMVPYFAIGLFTGMRPAIPDGEICKMAAHPDLLEIVNTNVGKFMIPEDVAKTGEKRQTTIQPNMHEWLAEYWIEDFPIIPTNAESMAQHIRSHQKLGHDILRHTFFSNHIGKFNSFSLAAKEGGNTDAVVRRHYHNPATEKEAELFWKISPTILRDSVALQELREQMRTLEEIKKKRPTRPESENEREYQNHVAKRDSELAEIDMRSVAEESELGHMGVWK